MVKLIIGVKGTGKTKTLIEMVNHAQSETNGCVVCIEKGNKLRYDVNSQIRLIDTVEYLVSDAQSLFGFVAGILASNYDVTDIFKNHIGKQENILLNDADVPAQRALGHLPDVHTVDADRTRGNIVKTHQKCGQRGLSATRCTDYAYFKLFHKLLLVADFNSSDFG